MENLFIKEVINGKLIEIDRLTVGIMLRVGITRVEIPEHEKIAHLMCAVTKINGERLDVKAFLDSDDIAVFNFISESFSAMTNNNIM